MSQALKHCPVCRCENAAADFFCQHCGIDISNVPAVVPVKATVPTPMESAMKKRTCPRCGQSSDAILPLCTSCGFELDSTVPSKLLFVIGGENYEGKEGDVLGREGTVARPFLSKIGTVSRRHASFTRQDGRWCITVAANVPNITQLDGVELPRGKAHPLSGTHVLKLSTQCEVQLRVVPE